LVDDSLRPVERAPCPARLASRGAVKAMSEVVSAMMFFAVAAARMRLLLMLR
jgi:hypothetical protein